MLLREAIIGAYWEESNLFLQCWYLVMEGLRSFVGCDLKKRSDLEQRNVVRGPKAPYPLFRESEKPTKITLQAFGEKKKGI